MAIQILNKKNSVIKISPKTIQKKKGVVILDLNEYQELCKRAVPTYYLNGKEAEELDRLAEEGLQDYENGKTIEAHSLKEALRIYGRKNKKS